MWCGVAQSIADSIIPPDPCCYGIGYLFALPIGQTFRGALLLCIVPITLSRSPSDENTPWV